MIVKGSPEQSLLYQKVSAHQMPPPAYKHTVPDSAIEMIKAWISGGAVSDQPVGALSRDATNSASVFKGNPADLAGPCANHGRIDDVVPRRMFGCVRDLGGTGSRKLHRSAAADSR